MCDEMPRYEITHDDVTAEAVVIQVDGKTIVQPVKPVVVRTGESFTIRGVKMAPETSVCTECGAVYWTRDGHSCGQGRR